MLGNMGPRKEWIWENIHSLCNKLNNEMQEKKLNNKNMRDFFRSAPEKVLLKYYFHLMSFGSKKILAYGYITC